MTEKKQKTVVILMNREEAFTLAQSRFRNRNFFVHVLAVEAVMSALTCFFGADDERSGH